MDVIFLGSSYRQQNSDIDFRLRLATFKILHRPYYTILKEIIINVIVRNLELRLRKLGYIRLILRHLMSGMQNANHYLDFQYAKIHCFISRKNTKVFLFIQTLRLQATSGFKKFSISLFRISKF